MSKVSGRGPDLSTLAANPSSDILQALECIFGTARESMAVQADVIAFDEAGSSAALEWLQLLHCQAARDPPKELFSLFTSSATVCKQCLSMQRSKTLDMFSCKAPLLQPLCKT